MKISIVILVAVICALLAPIGSGAAWADAGEGKEVLYLRPATDKDILGVWSARFTSGSFYHFRYVVFTADGRVGWVLSNTEPRIEDPAVIVEAIDKKEIPDGMVIGWAPWTFNKGMISIASEGKMPEQHFIKLLTVDQDEHSERTYLPGKAGDLFMQRFYQIPSDWPASAGPPHILAPAPWLLHRLDE